MGICWNCITKPESHPDTGGVQHTCCDINQSLINQVNKTASINLKDSIVLHILANYSKRLETVYLERSKTPIYGTIRLTPLAITRHDKYASNSQTVQSKNN